MRRDALDQIRKNESINGIVFRRQRTKLYRENMYDVADRYN